MSYRYNINGVRLVCYLIDYSIIANTDTPEISGPCDFPTLSGPRSVSKAFDLRKHTPNYTGRKAFEFSLSRASKSD